MYCYVVSWYACRNAFLLVQWPEGPTEELGLAYQMLGVILTCASSEPEISFMGGFLKWWYPTTMGFPTKNDHFGVFWGYHHLRKHLYSCFPPQPQPSLPPSVASSWCKLHCGSAPSLHPPMKLPLTQTFGTLLELVFSVNSLLKNVGKIQIRARGKGVEKIDEILEVRHQLSKINYDHLPQWATTNSKGEGHLENHNNCKQVVGNHANCNSSSSKLAITTRTTSFWVAKKSPNYSAATRKKKSTPARLGEQKKKMRKTPSAFWGYGIHGTIWIHMVLWYTQSPYITLSFWHDLTA